ncbi:MAG: winged helix DNA-binding domain-containing protein [Anaerolineae bacterium]|nr:winged helix DNA-binding domain-containing protein [Anaerolineae bacterium]
MDVAQQRLVNQHLVGTPLSTPEEVVQWLGAVQAQEYAHAKWALSLRMEPTTEPVIEQAFKEGRILRTHVMRPTWHFVTPEDIRWLLELTAPRVHAVNAYMYRKTELDDAIFGRSNEVIAEALQGSNYRTRTELAAELTQAGIVGAEGMRLTYLMMRAELDGLICSGPRRGKQFTYALIEERAPNAKTMPRDEALAELTRRFFTSHGPATIDDFAWWSGLTKADVKAGLELNRWQLVQEMIGERIFWLAAVSPSSVTSDPLTAHMLPIYDEYTIAYKNHDDIIDPPAAEKMKEVDLVVFTSTIEIGGQIVGVWKRTLEKDSVIVETKLFRALTSGEQQALNDALWRYGEYLGLGVVLTEA